MSTPASKVIGESPFNVISGAVVSLMRSNNASFLSPSGKRLTSSVALSKFSFVFSFSDNSTAASALA